MKKVAVVVALVAGGLLAGGCGRDPRIPLDEARKSINDIRAFQLQALALRGLQDDLQEAFVKDPHVAKADVGLNFASSDGGLAGQRLVVNAVILLELVPGAFEPPKPPPSATQPATNPAQSPPQEPTNAVVIDNHGCYQDNVDKCVQDLVRDLLARHKWEVEYVETYSYKVEWRIICHLRSVAAPPSAGIGLDILPKRVNGEGK